MASSYVNISEDEMHEFMTERGFVELNLKGVNEKVYGKLVVTEDPKVTLRVYTSIEKGSGGRPCGTDAIRLLLFTRLQDGEIKKIGETKTVYRIQTWRNNLQKKMEMWNEYFGPPCPQCRNHTVQREGRFGKFWGCVTYPHCTSTAKD